MPASRTEPPHAIELQWPAARPRPPALRRESCAPAARRHLIRPAGAPAAKTYAPPAVPPHSTAEAAEALNPGTGAHKFRPGAETRPFQAEVNRMMDIIVHSLYSNKDVFLRELISNSADALDKIRFLALTDKAQLGSGDDEKLEILLSIDKDRGVLTVRDRGIGMTRKDLISNLGTIAKSGTAAFLEQMQKGGDLNLIGQFGVGFYSVYLVADYVEQEAAQEYLQVDKIKELVAKYSEFINFPISLLVEKTVEKEVPLEEEKEVEDSAEKKQAADAAAEAKEGDEVEVEEDEDENEEGKPKTKKARGVSEKVKEWEVLNDNQALWLRPPGNISAQEYAKFYKALSKKVWEEPLAHSHFKAEGDVEFKAVLFLPPTAPHDMYDNYYTKKPRIKLYVRRVFISDDTEVLPKWLSFLVGLVDSDTMPLNVSREMLQLHEGLKVGCATPLVLILKMAQGSAAVAVWASRKRLLPLLRFHSSKSPEALTTLEEYKARAKEGQKHIYFLVGASREEVEKSPFVEALVEKDYEVLYLTDPLDEYMMGNVQEYEGLEFANVSKDDLKLTDRDSKARGADHTRRATASAAARRRRQTTTPPPPPTHTHSSQDRKADRKAREAFRGLTKWWKALLGADSSVSDVKVSKRLASTPCVVVSSKYGWSATMERIARAQALGDSERARWMRGQRTLEINPRHPLVKELKLRFEKDENDTAAIATARLLYEACLMDSGFVLDNVKAFNQRVFELIAKDMQVKDLTVDKVEGADAEAVEDEPIPAAAAGEEGAAGADADADAAGEAAAGDKVEVMLEEEGEAEEQEAGEAEAEAAEEHDEL
eukprot:scaffold1.g5289.t1